jgi:hypothetical protein
MMRMRIARIVKYCKGRAQQKNDLSHAVKVAEVYHTQAFKKPRHYSNITEF